MSEENVKVKENGQATMEAMNNNTEISLGELYGVSKSIFDLSSSVPSMKGKIVYALTKNEAILEKILVKTDKRQQEIIKKYVKLNKDGTPKLTEPTDEEIQEGKRQEYIYSKEQDKVKAATEIQDLMEEKVNIEFHKIWMNDFENLDIVPARNTKVGLFIKYLVNEKPDFQLTGK